MKIHILNPFEDSKKIWLGLDTPGQIRKVFRMIDHELVGSKHFVGGLTIFEPGESSSLHNHPGSEEIDIALKGSGLVFSEGETLPFREHDFMLIPDGVEHQHINNGNEPLWLVWIYGPPGELPRT